MCQNNDTQLRNCFDLIDTYTREEIKVEYILDCLYAELKVQSLPDIQDVLANSVLEFIWKIGNRSNLYTTETYRKLQLFGVLRVNSPALMILSGLSWTGTTSK